MHQVHWFDDVHRHHKKTIGLKAYRVAELYQAEIPVPYGFVIPSPALVALFGRRILKSRNTVHRFPDWASPIVNACRMVAASSLLAVRSSSNVEDGQHSYAGQAATVLGVSGDQEVLMALRSVWASMLKLNPSLSHPGGIIVQPMIEAEVSGVALSSHPTDPNSQALLLEAIYGLASPLMKGALTPDRVTVDTEGHILSYNLHLQPEALMVRSGVLKTIPLSSNRRQGRALSPEMIKAILELVVAVKDQAGSEIELEWAYARHKFWVLQARAVADSPRKTRMIETITSKPLVSGLTICKGQVRARVASDDPSTWQGKVVYLTTLTKTSLPYLTKAAAIVSTRTGWMRPEAVLGRELSIPTVMGVASGVLSPGQLVTVDANFGKVYQGKPQTVSETITLPKGVVSLTELEPSRSLWAEATTPLQLDSQVVMVADGFVTESIDNLSQWYFGSKSLPSTRYTSILTQHLSEWVTVVGSDRQIVIPLDAEKTSKDLIRLWIQASEKLNSIQPHQICIAMSGDYSKLQEYKASYKHIQWWWWLTSAEPLIYLDQVQIPVLIDLALIQSKLAPQKASADFDLQSRLTALLGFSRSNQLRVVRAISRDTPLPSHLPRQIAQVVPGIELPKMLLKTATTQ